MKKHYLLIAAGLVTLMSCSQNSQKATATDETAATDRVEVYKGVLPAADTEGIEYTVNLEYDADSNYTDGDFTMTQVYMSETDPATFTSKGDFAVLTGTPESSSQRYLRLVAEENPSDTTYFIVTNDSTITLVGSDLTPSVVMSYDLTKQ